MKVCRKCGLEKDLSEFYKKPNMADGHLNHCIACVKQYEKDRRIANSDRLKAYDKARANLPHRVLARQEYAKSDAGKLTHKKAMETYKARYPMKYAAHVMVSNAVRDGHLVRQTKCDECGSTEKIEGHHDDYTKPFEIRWLCEKCHKAWHKHNKPIYQ